MDLLRCKTPELVRKEIWTHVLAYNLIRTVMAQAAARAGVAPRSISFKATLQVLEAFRPLIAARANLGAGHRAALYQQVLRAIALHRVAARFGLSENAGYQPLGTRATVTASRRPCRSPAVSARSIEPPADRTDGPNALAATRRRATARLH
jgi:hypothetical protein